MACSRMMSSSLSFLGGRPSNVRRNNPPMKGTNTPIRRHVKPVSLARFSPTQISTADEGRLDRARGTSVLTWSITLFRRHPRDLASQQHKGCHSGGSNPACKDRHDREPLQAAQLHRAHVWAAENQPVNRNPL